MKSNEELYPNEPEHFREWWDAQLAKGALPEHEPIARDAWNGALDLAAKEFGIQEGTSFGVELRLRA